MRLTHKLIAIGTVTVVLLFGSILLISPARIRYLFTNPFCIKHSGPGNYSSTILWKRDLQGQWQLHHGYFRQSGVGGGSSLSNNPLRTLSSFGPDALRRGDKNSAQVLLFPGGLYINGVQMTTTDRVKVFVAGMNQEVYPISLTAEEMQQIRPDTWPVPFCDSDLWHTKFLPVVDPERAARLAAGPSKPIHDKSYHGGLYALCTRVDIPEAKPELQNAFFTWAPTPGGHTVWDEFHATDDETRQKLTFARRYFDDDVIVHVYPSRVEVNGEVLKRGEVYARSPDGTCRLVELSMTEKQSLAMSIIGSEKFLKSDVYIQKILPILTEPPRQPASH